MEAHESRLKIGVIGGGIGGIAAAWFLGKHHDVTLIERDERIGGHTNTIMVEEAGEKVPVDTGFIVCNERNYPVFYGLLKEWGASLRDSDMSFGFSCQRTGLAYVGPSLRNFAARPRNFFNPRFWGFVRSQRRFARLAKTSLEHGDLGDMSLGTYLENLGMNRFFIHNYLVPLAASVWSSPDRDMLEFPAETFLRFFDNHGMIRVRDIPRWQTVVGGSCAYVDCFKSLFPGAIMQGTPVESVRRCPGHVEVGVEGGGRMDFDHVVLATHADQALELLVDPSSEERSTLSSWRYHRSHVVLHSDPSVMPADRRLWASWNYRRPAGATAGDPVPITYYMNRLQNFNHCPVDFCVTLNKSADIDDNKVIRRFTYDHPVFTLEGIAAQKRHDEISGHQRSHFCGAYWFNGFHEDGVVSALRVTRALGVDL